MPPEEIDDELTTSKSRFQLLAMCDDAARHLNGRACELLAWTAAITDDAQRGRAFRWLAEYWHLLPTGRELTGRTSGTGHGVTDRASLEHLGDLAAELAYELPHHELGVD